MDLDAREIITSTLQLTLIGGAVLKNCHPASYMHHGGSSGAVPHAATLGTRWAATGTHHEHFVHRVITNQRVVDRHIGVGVVVHRAATPKAFRDVLAQIGRVQCGLRCAVESDATAGIQSRVTGNDGSADLHHSIPLGVDTSPTPGRNIVFKSGAVNR